jgi:hypothetical protein
LKPSMSRKSGWISVSLALWAPAFADASPDLDAVVVADRIRTAFLEDAPRDVRRHFKRAFDDACRAARLDPPKDDEGQRIPFELICDTKDPLRYLREVLVNGEPVEEGWICLGNEVGDLKYFPADWKYFSGCVRVLWDYSERKPEVMLDWLGEEEEKEG